MINSLDAARMENWNILDTNLFWAYDRQLTPELRQSPHLSNPFYALFLRQGTTTICYGSDEETYGAGQWIFPRNAAGAHRFSEDVHLLAIRFSIKWPNELSLFDRTESVVFPEEEASLLTRTATRLSHYIKKNDLLSYNASGFPRLVGNLDNYIAIKPLFDAWIAAYYNAFLKSGRQPVRFGPLSERMRVCLRYLRHRLLATPFYEKELAGIVGVSVSQICKVFVQEIGVTPQSFWNSRRLQTARLELLNTNRSIKEIAFYLGFSSPEHFARWFFKQAGSSPRAYRKAVAGSENS